MSIQILHARAQQLGFTIIEIMIAVALVAVISVLAFPSYDSSLAKGDRSIAVSDINEIAQALERYYTFNRTYSNDFADISMAATNATFKINDDNALYDYYIAIPRATTVDSVPQSAAKDFNYIIYAKPTARNRDQWTLSQNDLGFRYHYASDSTTSVDGWP
jgi:type IV pilus assembly protein PilE